MVDMRPEAMGMPTTVPPQKKGMGCWAWGCITVIVVLVLGAVGLYFGVRYFATSLVANYSTTAPLSIPSVPFTQEQLANAKDKLESFRVGTAGASGTDQLVLTAGDINALIASNEVLKDKVFIDIRDSEVFGKISINLEQFGFEGRFFNGEGKLQVSLRDGILHVDPQDISFNGQKIPDVVLEKLRGNSLASEMFKDSPDAAKFIQSLESINIADGKIVLLKKKAAQ